jgi:hypothetical protein
MVAGVIRAGAAPISFPHAHRYRSNWRAGRRRCICSPRAACHEGEARFLLARGGQRCGARSRPDRRTHRLDTAEHASKVPWSDWAEIR